MFYIYSLKSFNRVASNNIRSRDVNRTLFIFPLRFRMKWYSADKSAPHHGEEQQSGRNVLLGVSCSNSQIKLWFKMILDLSVKNG